MDWNERFVYDRESGELIWKPKPNGFDADWKRWNSRYAGKVAGHERKKSISTSAGKWIPIFGKHYAVHNIVAEMHGFAPNDGQVVDHIDGNPANNRLSNLRLATKQQNSFNAKVSKANRLGLKGVSYNRGRYIARIMVSGKFIHIGGFATKGEAAVARAKAALRLHGKYARLT